MTDLDSRPARPGRFHWGRVVSLAGAAGLCVSFFMPQVNFLGPVIPVKVVVQESDGLFLVTIGLPFLAAILLLPLLAFRAVPRMYGTHGVGKFLAAAVCAICLSVLSAILGWITYSGLPGGGSIGWGMIFINTVPAVAVVSLVLAIVALVRSRLPRKAAAAQFALGVSCLAYFTYFTTVGVTACAGLWLSIASSGMLAIGSAIDWFQYAPKSVSRASHPATR